MLSRYFRWASENHRLESLETLRNWITEESEYQVKAMESIVGSELKQSTKKTTVERIVPLPRLEEDEKKRLNFSENAIFVKVMMGYGRVSSLKMQMSMRDGESPKTRDKRQETIAKDKRLCFRCLCNSHQGKDCVRAGECGENGCRRSHHRLLHPSEEFGNREVSSNAESVSNPSSPSSRTLTTVTSDITEGNTEQATDEHSHITTLCIKTSKNISRP